MLVALRLSVIFSLLGLLTSRIALILHELLGHALPAALLGSEEVSWKFFWFAGGHVSFPRATAYGLGERMVLYLGGIAVELVFAAIGLAIARALVRGTLARVAVVGFTSIVLVHGLYYLTTGTYHGYGDGALLHHSLGSARPWLVAIGCALSVISALAVGRWIVRDLGEWLALERRGPRMLIIVGAILVAAGVHGGLTYGELKLRTDKTYGALMQPQSDRDAERELARYVAAARERGATLEHRSVANKRDQLREQHRRFPLRIVLGVAIACAGLFGLWTRFGELSRSERGENETRASPQMPSARSIGYLGFATASSVAAVAVVNALSG